MKSKKFYVTTAIDYVNAAPHIGHAYQKIIADVLARWNKVIGNEVLFLTGTDEYGKKVNESAEAAGKPVREFVDGTHKRFIEAWKSLNIEYDRFIRTTDIDHKKVVLDFIKKCEKNGDIYPGKYSGLYCVGCEQYYTEKDSEDGKCPIHKKELEKIEEETYFFKLSKYQKFLLDLYEKNPKFIQPKSRRNEIINRVKEGLNDLSITRTSFDWGIPFPIGKGHITYVWFDALINYYTATREKGREDFWGSPTVHLLGKDNTWFHTVYWPAMLKSAGIDLPHTTLNHGFLTFNGEKISKSRGEVVYPPTLVKKYSADSVRYFVCRHFPFMSGVDGDFEEKALVERHNGELLNKLGNLVSRVTGLIEKNGMEECKRNPLKADFKKISNLMENYEVDKALNEIFAFIDKCNEYVQEKKPWSTGDKKVLFRLADAIKKISILLYPFIPSTCEKISEKLGGHGFTLRELERPFDLKSKIVKGDGLFNRIEYKEEGKINKEEKIVGVMGTNEATFEDFSKLDLRVAQIKKVEAIEGADKLWKLTLDVGELGERTICAGIKEFYSVEELKGRKISYFSNLKPRKMRGVVSEGMLLAASNEDHSKVSLISPGEEIDNGSRIG